MGIWIGIASIGMLVIAFRGARIILDYAKADTVIASAEVVSKVMFCGNAMRGVRVTDGRNANQWAVSVRMKIDGFNRDLQCIAVKKNAFDRLSVGETVDVRYKVTDRYGLVFVELSSPERVGAHVAVQGA